MYKSLFIIDQTLLLNVCTLLQALKLAEYRPVIDVKHLKDDLQRVENTTDDAQRFFKSTRLRVVYYEDLVMDPEVGTYFSPQKF